MQTLAITRRDRTNEDDDNLAATPILIGHQTEGSSTVEGGAYQNVDENLKKKNWKESWWVAVLKIVLLTGMFLFFVGTVVLIVELIEHFHDKDVYSLNLHIKVGDDCTMEAQRLNAAITLKDSHQQIALSVSSTPHMTLYLTTFPRANQQQIIDAVNRTVFGVNGTTSWPQTVCDVTMATSIVASGDYTMWSGNKPPCLQVMSDMLVNATKQYVDARAFLMIPSWVDKLPQQLRDLKTQMIKNFASPNVFSQFDPHITIAHDDITPADMKKAVQGPPVIAPRNCTFTVTTVGVGLTGDYGTVQTGKDLAIFTFR
jgi:hypothetical protein